MLRGPEWTGICFVLHALHKGSECKPNPKLEAKPAPKPTPKGTHVQLFKMRRKVAKGFYSTAAYAPDKQRGPPEHAEICQHIVLYCLVATIAVRVRHE